MALAKRPLAPLKSKQDINPSLDRNTEVVAQDFADYNAILEDHANLIDGLTRAYDGKTFYGVRGSLALFQAEFPTAVEGYGIIDEANGNPQIIATVANGVWTATTNAAPIQLYATKTARPQPGVGNVIYIVKDEKILSFWYDGSYKDFGRDGYNGKSTYQIALDFGFIGTEEQWLVSLKGKSAYQIALDNGFVGTEAEWLITLKGATGKTAYELALDNGFVGTEAEWVESLGGIPGKSAYQVWLDEGNEGTEQDYLLSIKGAPGDPGPSNYQLWLDAGNVGTFQDYQDTLEGPPGPAGDVTAAQLEAARLSAITTAKQELKDEIDAPLKVDVSRALSASDIGKILHVIANVTLTYPNGGIAKMRFNIRCTPTGQANMAGQAADLDMPNKIVLPGKAATFYIEPVNGKLTAYGELTT